MNRFLLFTGDRYYPAGGWWDFKKSFNTAPEAAKVGKYGDARGIEVFGEQTWEWWQVVDLETLKMVDEGVGSQRFSGKKQDSEFRKPWELDEGDKKRFLLFAGNINWLSGGLQDFKKSFDTVSEAVKVATGNTKDKDLRGTTWEWWHVVDLESGEMVEEGVNSHRFRGPEQTSDRDKFRKIWGFDEGEEWKRGTEYE